MNTVTRSIAILWPCLPLPHPWPAQKPKARFDEATQAKITTELTAQGYEVRKIGQEDGMIEVYAVKDGKTYELYLDSDLKNRQDERRLMP